VRAPPAERLRRHVDQLHLVGAADHLIRHGLLRRDAGDLLDDVGEAGQVLDVHRGQHADPGGEQLLDVLPAPGVAGAGCVGVRQLVDDHQVGTPGEHRVDVQLAQGDAAVGNLEPGEDLQPLELLKGAAPR
jgi:hypothetical protein